MSVVYRVNQFFNRLKLSVNQWWYLPLIAVLTFLDIFVLFIPTDAILISSVLIQPKRWKQFVFAVALGAIISAIVLAFIVRQHGMPWLLDHYPQLMNSGLWLKLQGYFNEYGLWVILAVAMTPLSQQPTISLGALSDIHFMSLISVVSLGRFIKNLILGYVCIKAPHLLHKMWGLGHEMKSISLPESKSKIGSD